jgi:hypothetical protein
VRCSDSSSTSDASLAGSSSSLAVVARISLVQSGMLASRDALDRVDKLSPRAALLLEDCLALRRELVVPASPLTGLFHPATRDEAALFKPVEKWVKGGDIEL